MSQKDDVISRQAAIDKFEPWLKVRGYSEGELNMLKAVLYELRFLPSVQPEILACGEGELNVPDINVGDMISRQAAIDDIKAVYEWHDTVTEDRILDHLRRLPSAQPEIIQCKDCKRYGQDNCFMKIQMLWELKPDDFCSQAERRIDERPYQQTGGDRC